ncbi:1,4-alpha-glucan branching enzyme [Sporolactobacillus spathodeae]|uniref:1,4-alpha-glucan branching enzyme GlgB n=2 Tax=Sporolactobacillus spathodeae TaxID=1465502 RepID=A0ABS2Q8R7_9BACL|nr:1,4-alpha-glucan branching enzyme [Sporolactobacillus spathodeae]
MLTIENMPQLYPSDFDLYLFHEGTLYEGYKLFGAHYIEGELGNGFRFTVWAPNARAISVVGDFNDWKPNSHPLKMVKHSGVWTGFIQDLSENVRYKYAIETRSGTIIFKADPFAFYAEKRPATASMTSRLDRYEWHDHKWLRTREKIDIYHRPMAIYECHLGSWKTKDGELMSYRELADELPDYVCDKGFTHIELMPIMEHPFDRSWGYQVTGLFAPTSRFGSPEDFMYFVDACHARGIGVILDWAPAHFCRDAHGLGRFDGTPLYEPVDPRLADRPQWGTYNFDFSKNEVVSFLISSARFWMDVFHVEGFRIDAVSSMVYLNHNDDLPYRLTNKNGGEENLEGIEFLKKLNATIFIKFPSALMIAEEATDYPLVTAPVDKGGLGFNYKWNMGWVHDILRYMSFPPEQRRDHHQLITFSMLYAYSENFILSFSHDELVYGKRSLLNKMPGDMWQKFANLRALYGYFITHPGKKLLFMGSEFAQFDEWKDLEQVDWKLLDQYETHRSFLKFSTALNHFYQEHACLWRLDHEGEGFEWIDADNNQQSVISFIRRGKRKGDYCIVVCNFTPTVYHDFKIGVPNAGTYLEMFNSDAELYGGSGQCNTEPVEAEDAPWNNQPYALKVTLPPLGMSIFMKETKKRLQEFTAHN